MEQPIGRASVKSFVRIKPKDKILRIHNNTVEVLNKNNKVFSFEFDRVFSPQATTNDIFKELSPYLLTEDSRNLTILAYGQTGSGKTYTISGTKTNQGIEMGLIHQIIDLLLKTQEIKISFIEVYNEKVIDAIDSKEKIVREINGRFFIQDLVKQSLNSMSEFQEIWDIFIKNRRVSETNLNMHSSRSHSIARIETFSNLINLVDLAGSENNKKTGNTGERMKESQNINTSLFVLNKVVNSIIKKEIRIPYRDSKLTRLLKESLSGEDKCFIIATVIDELDEAGLTTNTLSFASKSRQILTIEKPVTEIDFVRPFSKIQKKDLSIQNKEAKELNADPLIKKCNLEHSNEQQTSNSNFDLEFQNIEIRKVIKNRKKDKSLNSSSIIKGQMISNQIEMTPITKQKSKECFLNKAIEYEKTENYKMAIDTYKTVYKISQSKDIENKIVELTKLRKSSTKKISETAALYALNSGSFIEIKKLNGIGDKRAKIIVDFINGGNSFEVLEDLKMLFNQKIVQKIFDGIDIEKAI